MELGVSYVSAHLPQHIETIANYTAGVCQRVKAVDGQLETDEESDDAERTWASVVRLYWELSE